MQTVSYDIIRGIADALYRSTGAVAFTLLPKDVRVIAEAQAYVEPLTDAECLEILDCMVDGADLDPFIQIAVEAHFDAKDEAKQSSISIIKDLRLKLAELEGAIAITEGAQS